MNLRQPKRIVVHPSKNTKSKGGGVVRQPTFSKDWLYLNIQSDLGCILRINVCFKQEFQSISATRRSSMPTNNDIAT